jgi:hypothetical protein
MLQGHSILIVEPEVGPFIARLQAAVDDLGAETLVVRDPTAALERCERFSFSAALVNTDHRPLLDELTARNIPALLYIRAEGPNAIVGSLGRMLSDV